MDEDSVSNDFPSQSNPATPLMSNPVTPRNERNGVDVTVVTSSVTALCAPSVTRQSPSKYTQLLAVIEEMGKDIRPTYAGSKSSAERLKRGIVHARILLRECLMETERNARS
ncbi:cyclin-dependent kinase 2-associated protein 2-like isoform X2 [Limulus polyphemus]|nr:cyclin-dependent kinase 2-associated protein 2-like isoform X2 [Limulus polyphemus]